LLTAGNTEAGNKAFIQTGKLKISWPMHSLRRYYPYQVVGYCLSL